MAISPKQEVFAQYYATHRNGADAYRHAYNCSDDIQPQTAAKRASELLADGNITGRIDQIIAAATQNQPVTMTLQECFARWLTMASADPDEITGLRVGSCHHCWGEGNKYQWKELEYLDALSEWERAVIKDPSAPMPDIGGGFGYMRKRPPNMECPKCEGQGVTYQRAVDTSQLSDAARMIYGGVKPTRNGWEVILADRVKCLENASRIIGAFTDKVRLDGSLTAMVAAIQVADKDPNEAARMYLDMVQAIAAK